MNRGVVGLAGLLTLLLCAGAAWAQADRTDP